MPSTHEVKVIRIEEIRRHGNADTLAVVPVWGYTCCVRIGDFQVGDLAAYIEPDTLVPVDRPEFSFLADKAKESYEGMARIRAAKLRGVVSMGLLIKARPGWEEGDNVMEALGCKHYDPPVRGMSTGGDNAPAPSGLYYVKYDIENLRRYPDIFQKGELVHVTEKIHGANARFCFTDGELHVSSHTSWKKRDDKNLWWQAALAYDLEEKLAEAPGLVFYGEVYGRVQDLRYGAKNDDPPRLAFFDIMDHGKWLAPAHVEKLISALGLPIVPLLYIGSWEPDLLRYAEGPSRVEGADHIREGCVIKPITPRSDDQIGRVILKVVGNGYLTRKSKTSPHDLAKTAPP